MQTWPGATGSGQGLGLVASAIGLQRERPVWWFRGEHNARGLAREALMTPAVQLDASGPLGLLRPSSAPHHQWAPSQPCHPACSALSSPSRSREHSQDVCPRPGLLGAGLHLRRMTRLAALRTCLPGFRAWWSSWGAMAGPTCVCVMHTHSM